MANKPIRQVPQTAGMYWARKWCAQWWHLIVCVQGEAPMLRIVWMLDLMGCDAPRVKPGTPGDVEEWGPEIPDCAQAVELADREKE